MEVFHNLFFSGFFFVAGYAKFFVTGCSLFYKKCLTLKWYRMVPFCEGVGKGSNLVKKRKIMEKFFSVSRKVLGGLFVFLAIASIVSGAVYSTGALVVKLLIAELLYAGLCFLFLFLAERTWDSCDSFVERLGMGALSVGVFGVVVGFPAYLFGADLWTGIGALLAVAGLGLGLVIIAGLMISLVICG